MRGTVEVRLVTLKRLVRLRDMKPIAQTVVTYLITSNYTSNYLRGK